MVQLSLYSWQHSADLHTNNAAAKCQAQTYQSAIDDGQAFPGLQWLVGF